MIFQHSSEIQMNRKRKKVKETKTEVKQEELKSEEVEEENQAMDDEAELEDIQKKIPKKIKMEEQKEKEIDVVNDDDDDDDDDSDDAYQMLKLQYNSDDSIDNDNAEIGVINCSSKLQLTPKEKLKLSNLFITFKNQVPPQHKIEKTAGTRALTKEEKQEFEKYATLRSGTFSNRENKTIRKNWKDFCNEYKWNVNNPKPFLQMRHKNKVAYLSYTERKKFMQFLANGLNNRSLYSVFCRFKVLFDPHKISRYSSSEDDIIITFIQKYKIADCDRDRKFAELATILKRTRASVYRRYRVLKRKLKILDTA